MPLAWKYLGPDLRVEHQPGATWVVGEWREHSGPLVVCHAGYHASDAALDAMHYGVGDKQRLAVVEYDGDTERQFDKVCARRMRVVAVASEADSLAMCRAFAKRCAERAKDCASTAYASAAAAYYAASAAASASSAAAYASDAAAYASSAAEPSDRLSIRSDAEQSARALFPDISQGGKS